MEKPNEKPQIPEKPETSWAFLEYVFMFDPLRAWGHIDDFEKDLADFFSSYGFEAQILKTIGGYEGKRVLYITKVEGFDIKGQISPPQKGIQKLESIAKELKPPKKGK